MKFERVRRITGYLNTIDKFNDGKQAEVKERVKHKLEEKDDKRVQRKQSD